MASRAAHAGRLLIRHPLFIALTSALIAALVLPPLTRSWQDRQKELELKRDLGTQIAEASTLAVRRGIAADGPIARRDARREWLVQRSITNAIIATYFPTSSLADCWWEYSNAITGFFELYRGEKQHDRLINLLQSTRESCEWDQELPRAEKERLDTLWSDRATAPVSDLGELLLIAKDGIIRRIVDAEARGYAHGLL